MSQRFPTVYCIQILLHSVNKMYRKNIVKEEKLYTVTRDANHTEKFVIYIHFKQLREALTQRSRL